MNRRTLLAFAIGPLASAALGFVTVPLIAWYFSPDDVGRNAMLLTVTAFALLIFVLGLDQAFVREFHEVDHWHRLFKSCAIPGLLALVLILLITTPLARPISRLLYGESHGWWYVFTAASILCAFLNRFLGLILRMQERAVAFSASQVIPKAAVLLGVASFAVGAAQPSFTALLMANTAAALLGATFLTWKLWRELRLTAGQHLKRSEVVQLLRFGAPLIGGGIAFWALNSAATFALRIFSGLHELGIYATAMSLAAITAVFQMIFTTVWMPTVYKWVAAGENIEKIEDGLHLTLAIGCVLAAVVGLFAWVAEYLLPPAYHRVKFLVAACVMQNVLYAVSEATVVGLNVRRKTGMAALAVLGALAVSVALLALLTPIFGAAGAAASASIAFGVFMMFRTEASNRVWRPVARKRLYASTVILVSLSVVTALAGKDTYLPYGIAWGGCVIGFVVAYRRELRKLSRMLNRNNDAQRQ
jgi:O-antigen/teichoic acid export membrane protein